MLIQHISVQRRQHRLQRSTDGIVIKRDTRYALSVDIQLHIGHGFCIGALADCMLVVIDHADFLSGMFDPAVDKRGQRAFAVPDVMSLNGNLKAVAARARKLAEKLKIAEVLAETGFNRVRAAAILEISYKTLLDKMKEYGLAPQE